MKPPAKVSPAPVGSWTSSSGNAGTQKTQSLWTIMAPCSPRLMTSVLGPSLKMLFRGAQQIVLVRELASFGIVDHQTVPCGASVSRNSAGVPSIQ